jgi:polyketide biosynthesis enoyl-CoA hydratase PksI
MSESRAAAPVTLTVSPDGVAEIAMCSADGHNALTDAFAAALEDAIAQAAATSASRVLLLTGTPEVFCSGASKAVLLRLASGDLSPADLHLPRVVLGAALPVIAAMEGHAVGGGFALGLCADIVLLARESRYGCNFMELGITPGMGTTRLLEQALSPALAQELLFTGELRRGADFAGIGGFNYILPRAQVRSKAIELAHRVVDKPRLALETLKSLFAERRLAAFEAAFKTEARMHRIVLGDPATRKRIEAEFVE